MLQDAKGGTVIPPTAGKASRGASPSESLNLDYITLFEGDGLLVLKDGFSGFVILWEAAAYNASTTEAAVIEWAALFGAYIWLPMGGRIL